MTRSNTTYIQTAVNSIPSAEIVLVAAALLSFNLQFGDVEPKNIIETYKGNVSQPHFAKPAPTEPNLYLGS